MPTKNNQGRLPDPGWIEGLLADVLDALTALSVRVVGLLSAGFLRHTRLLLGDTGLLSGRLLHTGLGHTGSCLTLRVLTRLSGVRRSELLGLGLLLGTHAEEGH